MLSRSAFAAASLLYKKYLFHLVERTDIRFNGDILSLVEYFCMLKRAKFPIGHYALPQRAGYLVDAP